VRDRESGTRDTDAAQDPSEYPRLVLDVLMGGTAEIRIGDLRFRLSQERVFRLEEIHGGFVYYLRNTGALARRLAELERRSGDIAGECAVRKVTPVSRN
jgi:hypothetical protein